MSDAIETVKKQLHAELERLERQADKVHRALAAIEAFDKPTQGVRLARATFTLTCTRCGKQFESKRALRKSGHAYCHAPCTAWMHVKEQARAAAEAKAKEPCPVCETTPPGHRPSCALAKKLATPKQPPAGH